MKLSTHVFLTFALLARPMLVIAQQYGDFYYGTNTTSAVITGYSGPGGEVTIPDTIAGLPVGRIGDSAFNQTPSLSSVTIPNSVTNLGKYAFQNCASLTGVTLGNGITSIGDRAFDGCTNLTSIAMPDSVVTIGSYAFSATGITNVTIPGSVTNIGVCAFSSCASLTGISVEEANASYTSVDGVLFDKSRTTLIQCPGGKAGSYAVPSGVTTIAVYACSGCRTLLSVTVPSSVTYIEGRSFGGCTNLTSMFFLGDAPAVGVSPFAIPYPTVYHLPGTSWGPTFGNCLTKVWKPQVQTADASFGVQTNRFGFNIAWVSGQTVVVQVATGVLHRTNWVSLQTNTLTADSLYFSDPEWTNHPMRFYRVGWP